VPPAPDPSNSAPSLPALTTNWLSCRAKPLLRVCVDAQIIGEVVSPGREFRSQDAQDESPPVLKLEQHLARARHRQDTLSPESPARAHRASGSGRSGKPVGVFLLVGPSGVGKTETALALSDSSCGERNLISINMSEFQEAIRSPLSRDRLPAMWATAKAACSPKPFRRRPYSVVLLDEVEKAHPDVLELFFQVFDKGKWKMAKAARSISRTRSCILTSNAATDSIMS